MARQFVGLDLGTAHTRIWTPEGGVILRSPSAAAIDSESHRIVALGADARRMLGKPPPASSLSALSRTASFRILKSPP